MKAWVWVIGLSVAGCKGGDKPAEPDGSGVKECDEYVAALEACIGKLPADQRAPMEQQLRNQKDALAKADPLAKKQMRDGCRTGRATLEADQRCK